MFFVIYEKIQEKMKNKIFKQSNRHRALVNTGIPLYNKASTDVQDKILKFLTLHPVNTHRVYIIQDLINFGDY
jgi:hypothetical protein